MKSGVPLAAGWVALGLAALVSFGIDWNHLGSSGSIDLRNRITGVRLLAAGRDPFHYKWRPSEPERYCDPFNNLAVPVSKTTVTPTFLILHLPLGWLPYRASQYLWLIAQWLCLLGMAACAQRILQAPGRSLFAAALITGFTFTAAWRLHAERGQCYVVLALLLTAWIALSREKSPSSSRQAWAGALAGILVAIRPPLLLILAPFLVLRRPDQGRSALIALLASAALPLLFDLSCWADYGKAMQTWSELYRSGVNPRPPGQAFPASVEGIPIDLLGRFVSLPFADSSLVYLLRREFHLSSVPAFPLLAALIVLLAAWLWMGRRLPSDPLLLGIACWAFLIDFFLPALRNSYNDVLILAVIPLAILRTPGSFTSWLAAFAWPAGWLILLHPPRNPWLISLPALIWILFSSRHLLRPCLDSIKRRD